MLLSFIMKVPHILSAFILLGVFFAFPTVVSAQVTTIKVVATDRAASESGLPATDTGRFTITRTGATTSPLTVNYTVSGTATGGSDYEAIGTSVIISAGAASASVTVTPLADTIPENDETVVMRLAPHPAYTVGRPSYATVIISDNNAPRITRVSPLFGSVGTLVTITGTRFGATQETSTITFNGVRATPSSWSNTKIVASVPDRATTGPVAVTVRRLFGNKMPFRVIPKIDSVSPSIGSAGTSVTITGTGFGAVQGRSRVTFNGVVAGTSTRWTTTAIDVRVPSGVTTGPVIVTVGGQASNGVAFTVTAGNQVILFSSDRTGEWEIYRMNRDGSDLRQLTSGLGSSMGPEISPDGRQILFSVDNHQWDIYLMNIDGSGLVRLTDHPGDDGDGYFSPDGNRIVFVSSRAGGDIFIMNRDGSGITQLTSSVTESGDSYPQFSPDGARILFSSDRAGVDRDHIYLMNTDGTNVTRLGTDLETDTGNSPRFSPDGTKIVFSDDTNGNQDIYLMNRDGSNRVRLTNDPGFDGHASFLQNGSQILFGSDRAGGTTDLYLMNLDGTGLIRLTDHPAEDFAGVVAP